MACSCVQVTNPRLQCDFLSMAASAQWRDTAGAVSEIAGSHLGTSVTIANLNAAVGAAVQAMSNNPAHEVCLLTSQGNC